MPGRQATRIITALREQLATVPAGSYLPGERDLALQHDVARRTVSRALETLERDGLLRCVPRHGYLVLGGPTSPAPGGTLAYVRGVPIQPWHVETVHGHLLAYLDALAARRQWTVLSISALGRSPAEVAARLRDAGVCGVVLEVLDRVLLEQIAAAGLPAIAVDAWIEDCPIDAVLQDGYAGSLLATNWLLARDHRRIAWFGPAVDTSVTRDRFGGYAAALMAGGGSFDPSLWVRCDLPDVPAAAEALLTRPDRPHAIVALWRRHAAAIMLVAQRLGLRLHQDYDLVGWSTAEDHAFNDSSVFPAGQLPPTVVWSVRDMAETAVLRLEQRRDQPQAPLVQLRLPVRLLAADTPA